MPRTVRRAFTLIELLVVIGIMGLLVAASLPAFARFGNQMRLKATTRQTLALLTLARQLAVSSNEQRTVLVDPGQQRLVIEETLNEDEPKRVVLQTGVEASVSPGDPKGPWRVIFLPSGGLSGRSATVTLTSEGRSQSIAIIATTGAVSVSAARVAPPPAAEAEE